MEMDLNDTANSPMKTEHGVKIAMLTVESITFLVNVSLAVLIIYKRKLLRRKSNRFLLNMILSDTCVALSSLSLTSMSFSEPMKDVITAEVYFFVQKPFLVLFSVFLSLSISNLSILTLDRLIAVKRPFFYTDRIRGRHVSVLIAFGWVISASWCICLVLVSHKAEMSLEYFMFVSCICDLIVILLGFVILCSSNILIFIDARKQLEKMKLAKQFNDHHKSHCRECRLVYMTLGLVVVYTISWTPYLIFNILCLHTLTPLHPTYVTLGQVSWVFMAFGYLVNPILYVKLSADVKREVKKLIPFKKSQVTFQLTNSAST